MALARTGAMRRAWVLSTSIPLVGCGRRYNTLDQNAIVGRHPVVKNFLFANGFSGHGVQQAPAVGRGITELISRGAYQTIDITPLGYERVLEGRPLQELNVI